MREGGFPPLPDEVVEIDVQVLGEQEWAYIATIREIFSEFLEQ